MYEDFLDLTEHELEGKHSGLSDFCYHNSKGFSRSTLINISKSLKHLAAEKKDTKAMAFGRAFHDAILSPLVFKKQYVVKPTFAGTGSRKAGNAWLEEHKGLDIISRPDFDLLRTIQQRYQEHPVTRDLQKRSQNEVSYYHIDQDTNLLFKCRPDIINYTDQTLWDLKTSAGAITNSHIIKTILNYFYDFQAGMYCELVSKAEKKKFNKFNFIFIEKQEPFDIRVVSLSEAMLENGKEIFHELKFRLMASLVKMDEYDGISNKIDELEFPNWSYNIDKRLGYE